MVFLCLKLKAVAAYLHVEKIKQMEGRQAQYTRSLKPPCHGDEPTRSWSARGSSALQCIQAKISKTLDKSSLLIFAANCTEQKLSSSESYYLTPNL